MKRNRTALRRGRGEQGQVLILAVVALILVIIAVLLLFDVQTVIRGKVKAQNGVDAAALQRFQILAGAVDGVIHPLLFFEHRVARQRGEVQHRDDRFLGSDNVF